MFRIASVAGGFHLATQGKAVGYDRYILARVGLRIGGHSRTPSRKIPRQTETLVSHSSLHGISVALVFLQFPSATIFLVITSLHERCYIGCSSWCVSRTPPCKAMGSCHFLIVTEVSQHLREKHGWGCVPPSPSGHILLLQGKDVGTHGIEAVQSLSRVWLHET